MKQLEVGWKAFYQTEISQDVRYIVLPKGKEWVCALARNEPLTLAKWKELFRRVDLDEEEMNADLNVVQEAGVMIYNRLCVCEVRVLAEELQYQPGKRVHTDGVHAGGAAGRDRAVNERRGMVYL